jgi:hypothetical protein
MAITYNSTDIRGVAAEPIVEELIFENKTVADELVSFEDDIKAETIFTETSATATMQAYTCGVPTAAGSLNAFDTVVTPVKVQYYQEFCPETLRFSRFKRDMKPGAWENFSTEFERIVIGGVYAKQISADLENKFWVNALAATKTAVAALTPGAGQASVGAAEQTLVAATTAGLFDGIVTKMIYNASNATATAGVGTRVKVAGTTITAANIKAEYDKVYAAIPAVALQSQYEKPYLYVPHSHMQFINIYNNTPTNYTKPFDVNTTTGQYFYNGLEIKFVPLPENVIIAAPKINLIWATDLKSDFNKIQVDKIANNREDYFIKAEMTIATHVVNQKYNVLYVG